MKKADEFEPIELTQQIIAAKWLVLGLGALCMVIAVLATFMVDPVYTAQLTLLPQEGSPGRDLLGKIALMGGGDLPLNSGNEDLYDKIIKSSLLLSGLLEEPWSCENGPSVSLYEVLLSKRERQKQSAIRRASLMKHLRRRVVGFSRDRKTGYMVLTVKIPNDPVLAANLANYLGEELEDYNREYRQRQARRHREFIETQVSTSKGNLDLAEDRLSEFLEANRSPQDSPSISRHLRELTREVEALTAIWAELRRQLAIARVDENRMHATLNVLDRATPPVRPSAPRRALIGSLGFVIGLVGSMLGVWGRNLRRS